MKTDIPNHKFARLYFTELSAIAQINAETEKLRQAAADFEIKKQTPPIRGR